jgi:hypothetical protein
LAKDLENLGLPNRIIDLLLHEKDKPEGRVRISWVKRLITEYKFPANQLDINAPAGVESFR